MALFVCLPCFAKQEIKQVLEIPFVLLENSEKSNKNSVCQNFTKTEKNKTFCFESKKRHNKLELQFWSKCRATQNFTT